MLVIERRAAALFHAALRRCFNGSSSRADQIPVLGRLTKNGMFWHCRQEEFAILYYQPEPTGKGVFAFPAATLGRIEGRTADPVQINLQRPELAQACWTERGTSRSVEIPLVDPGTVAVPPELPKEFIPLPRHFVQALDEAARCAAAQNTKYVVTKVQLRGKAGSVVATDTRQLLVQTGFEFPFTEDLLLPCCDVFGLAPLHQYEDVGIGRTDTHVAIRIGPWTFVLLLDKEGRYPDAAQIIPRNSNAVTRLQLHPNDVQRFLDNLGGRIKGAAAREEGLTLDLNQPPCLRFELDGRVIEIPLAESQVSGEPLRIGVSLAHFLRAIELRFQQFEIRHPDKPIVARDDQRIYMSMPLSSSAILPPQREAECPTVQSEPAVEPSCEAIPVPAVGTNALVPLPAETIPPAPMIIVPSSTALETLTSGSIDVLGEAEGFATSVMRAAEHAGRLLRYLRGVCAQPRLVHVVRSSFLSLFDKSKE